MCRVLTLVSLMVGVLANGSSATAGGPDPRLFHAAESPGAVFGIDTPRVVGHLKPFVGLTVDYANDELVSLFKGVRTPLLSRRWTWEFAAGFGVTDRLEFALAVPVQAIGGTEDADLAADVGDVRLRVKARLLGARPGETGLGLGLVGELGLPTAGGTPFAGSGGVSGSGSLLASYTLARGPVFALSLGARGVGAHAIQDLSIGSELRWGAAIDVPLVAQLAILGEVDGAIGLAAPDQFPIEARFGVRVRFGAGASLRLAGGAGLTRGYGAPDWRFMAGFVWVPGETTSVATLAPSEIARADGTGRPKPAGHHPDPQDPKHAHDPHPGDPPDNPHPDVAGLDPVVFDTAADADPDPDQDGVLGGSDACPTEPEDLDSFEDVDGCPDPDNDADGLPDVADKCREQPETINGIDDADGCPDGKGATNAPRNPLDLAQAIVFQSGSDVLEPAADGALKQIAALLRANGSSQRVVIEGHTDGWGDPELNVDLSERRAQRVRAFLIAEGVAEKVLVAKGFGATKPIADNKTPEGRAKNRRVVFTIVNESSRPKPEVTP